MGLILVSTPLKYKYFHYNYFLPDCTKSTALILYVCYIHRLNELISPEPLLDRWRSKVRSSEKYIFFYSEPSIKWYLKRYLMTWLSLVNLNCAVLYLLNKSSIKFLINIAFMQALLWLLKLLIKIYFQKKASLNPKKNIVTTFRTLFQCSFVGSIFYLYPRPFNPFSVTHFHWNGS